MTLAGLRCACGSPDVVLVAPGRPVERAPGGFVTTRGIPVTARCLACWPAAELKPEPDRKPRRRKAG